MSPHVWQADLMNGKEQKGGELALDAVWSRKKWTNYAAKVSATGQGCEAMMDPRCGCANCVKLGGRTVVTHQWDNIPVALQQLHATTHHRATGEGITFCLVRGHTAQ